MIIVFDIGGTSIKGGLFVDDKLTDKFTLDVPATFEEMLELFKQKAQEVNATAISISTPGGVNAETGEGFGITAISYIPSLNMKTELQKLTGLPVAIENDANCAALSEIYYEENLSSIAYYVIGSGIGGSVIVNDQIVTGHNFMGGEFGYINIDNKSASEIGAFSGLVEKASRYLGRKVTGKEVFELADSGDLVCKQLVFQTYQTIAKLCVMNYFTFNPQKYIFSGAVTNRPQFTDELEAAIKYVLINSPGRFAYDSLELEVSISKFGSDANLYGAYANYKRREV